MDRQKATDRPAAERSSGSDFNTLRDSHENFDAGTAAFADFREFRDHPAGPRTPASPTR